MIVGYPWQESEWMDYSPDDPAWEEDMGLVVEFQRKSLALLFPNGQPARLPPQRAQPRRRKQA